MFNPEKCSKCRYHGRHNNTGQYVKEIQTFVYCNYASIMNETCLKRAGVHTSVDSRGTDPENCRLFCEGERIKSGED